MAGLRKFAHRPTDARDDRRWVRFRMLALGAVLILALAALLARAAELQITQGRKLTSLAREQYLLKVAIPGKRGTITDRSGAVLAASAPVDSIYADMSQFDDPRALRTVADALHLGTREVASLTRRFDVSSQFTWIKRQATPGEAETVRRLQLPGIGMVRESRRFYPERELAAQLLGITGVDGEGLEGLERRFDEQLRGRSAEFTTSRDARGHEVNDDPVNAPELAGADVQLTIDRNLQYVAEQALARGLQTTHANAGVAAILDPQTGAVLALAIGPSFNPNAMGEHDREALRDRAVTDAYEPGSTFKPFLVASALEEKVVSPETLVFAENGAYTLNGRTIHDHKPYGWLSVPQVLQVSSNIGATKIVTLLGREKFARYLRDFGFGQRTEVGLPGEVRGQLPPLRSDIAMATAAFGQGVTATPMQLMQGYVALANGGKLMRPYLVSKLTNSDGTTIETGPEVIRQVVSPRTAAALTPMLERVVEKGGTAEGGAVKGFLVAGKTGTAQKVDPLTGTYSADKRFSSFVGYLPADAPRAVIGVFIDEPKGEVAGGKVAAPIFREIAKETMRQLGIQPDPKLLRAATPLNAKAPAKPNAKPAAALVASTSDSSEDDDAVDEPPAPGGVPRVVGLSLRAALANLKSHGLTAVPTGSGRVVAQRPRAGQPMPQNRAVSLTLEPSGRAPLQTARRDP